MLHGEIKINDYGIYEWQAENLGERREGKILYRCMVKGTDNAGCKMRQEFSMWHNPSDGALVLVALILKHANNYVRR